MIDSLWCKGIILTTLLKRHHSVGNHMLHLYIVHSDSQKKKKKDQTRCHQNNKRQKPTDRNQSTHQATAMPRALKGNDNFAKSQGPRTGKIPCPQERKIHITKTRQRIMPCIRVFIRCHLIWIQLHMPVIPALGRQKDCRKSSSPGY